MMSPKIETNIVSKSEKFNVYKLFCLPAEPSAPFPKYIRSQAFTPDTRNQKRDRSDGLGQIRKNSYQAFNAAMRLIYLPIISNSRFTTDPFLIWWKLVLSKV